MSERIKSIIETYLVEHGRAGKIELSRKLKCHEATLNRWLKDGFPGQHEAYKLVMACGQSKEIALRLAREEIPLAAKKKASA